MNLVEDLKYQFLFKEIFQFSINAAFSTRNFHYPIYNKGIIRSNSIKSELRFLIEDYIIRFKAGDIGENDHFIEIEKISEIISSNIKHADQLYVSRFRIGISQKLLNLTLKYLWTADKIQEPHHCPIDGIVMKTIRDINPNITLKNWTELDSIREYRDYINAIKEIAAEKNITIAHWELDIWNKRELL